MKRITAQSGFSLVELILVIAVAGMIIVVLANIVPAMKLIGVSNNENTARQIAAKRIEDLRAQGYDNLGGDGTSAFSDSRLVSLPQGAASTNLEPCPSTVCVNSEPIRKVTVSVTWVEDGKNKEFLVATLIAQGGLK